MDFAVTADLIVKIKESKKLDKYLNLAKELKQLWNMKVNGDTNCNLYFLNCPKSLKKTTTRKQKKSGGIRRN